MDSAAWCRTKMPFWNRRFTAAERGVSQRRFSLRSLCVRRASAVSQALKPRDLVSHERECSYKTPDFVKTEQEVSAMRQIVLIFSLCVLSPGVMGQQKPVISHIIPALEECLDTNIKGGRHEIWKKPGRSDSDSVSHASL